MNECYINKLVMIMKFLLKQMLQSFMVKRMVILKQDLAFKNSDGKPSFAHLKCNLKQCLQGVQIQKNIAGKTSGGSNFKKSSNDRPTCQIYEKIRHNAQKYFLLRNLLNGKI